MNTKIFSLYRNSKAITPMYRDLFFWITVILLITLFIYTGLGKIIGHNGFEWQLNKQPLPSWSKPILLYALPIIELTLVLLIYIERFRRLGLAIASLLLATYSIYAFLAYIEFYGYVICACGKVFAKMGWREHFWFNTALTAATALSCWFAPKTTIRKNNKSEQNYA